MNNEDIFCLEMLEKPDKAEAMQWFKEGISNGKVRTVGELNEKKTEKILTNLYELGSITVFAVEIDSYEDGDQTTDSLIVELPEDKNLRAKLFKEIGKHAIKQGFDPDEDVGQKYLFMHW